MIEAWNDQMRDYTAIMEQPLCLDVFLSPQNFGLWIMLEDKSEKFVEDQDENLDK